MARAQDCTNLTDSAAQVTLPVLVCPNRWVSLEHVRNWCNATACRWTLGTLRFGRNPKKLWGCDSGWSYLGISKNSGNPKWMVKIMENPIKMDDLGGPPLFLETPISLSYSSKLYLLGEVIWHHECIHLLNNGYQIKSWNWHGPLSYGSLIKKKSPIFQSQKTFRDCYDAVNVRCYCSFRMTSEFIGYILF